jgi:hypothetical protein
LADPWVLCHNIPSLHYSLYLRIRVLLGVIFSNNIEPVIAKVRTGGSSLEDRELSALAGNDTVISPVTPCLQIQVHFECIVLTIVFAPTWQDGVVKLEMAY